MRPRPPRTRNTAGRGKASAQADAPLTRPSDIAAIVEARHGDPFAVLGLREADGGLVARAMLPDAEAVEVIDAADGSSVASLTRAHEAGFFEGRVEGRDRWFPYRLRVAWPGQQPMELEDPYRFPAVLGDQDIHYLSEGTHLETWKRLGAHPHQMEGVEGTAFSVWAPNASRVAVVGDFNNWDGRRHPMRLRHGPGVWEIFLPGVGEGARYKYEIKGPNGQHLPLKADPYAFYAEQPPAQASVVAGRPSSDWNDGDWMAGRADPPGDRRPDLDLRGPSRQLAAGPGRGQPLPDL